VIGWLEIVEERKGRTKGGKNKRGGVCIYVWLCRRDTVPAEDHYGLSEVKVEGAMDGIKRNGNGNGNQKSSITTSRISATCPCFCD